jgi:hypothetical protein
VRFGNDSVAEIEGQGYVLFLCKNGGERFGTSHLQKRCTCPFIDHIQQNLHTKPAQHLHTKSTTKH